MQIKISLEKDVPIEKIIHLYKLNRWSSAQKPDLLHKALKNSDSLVSAWAEDQLVGLGNAITDGYLVVYFPHLLVHPDWHNKGIGKMIVDTLKDKYKDFHMLMLTADRDSVSFYEKMGFTNAGHTQSMWIYSGNEH
jgi:GNAT superfamily N-acetyltransferase